MAIKAGQILHVANQFVVDRLQTAGPGDLNIPTEKINELGNKQSVATVRNQPDLTFTLDALDVSTEIEAILTGKNGDGQVADAAADLPAKTADTFGLDGTSGTKYVLENYLPVDITSPLKSSLTSFVSVRGVAVPGLALESASYRYGLTDNAGETFSLRTDSIFYVPGHPYVQSTTAGSNGQTAFPFTAGNLAGGTTALTYTSQGEAHYAYNVTLIKTALGTAKRLLAGVDYTETAAGVTMTTVGAAQIASGDVVRMVYGSTVSRTYAQSVHQGVSVKPAAIKGKDIQVFIGTYDADETAGVDLQPFFWTGVQSANVDWRVTLEDDYEFGNPRLVARDFADVPAVTGSIEIKPTDMTDLFTKIEQISGVTAGEVVGPASSVALPLEIRLLNPESGGVPKDTDIPGGVSGTDVYDYGTVLKTLYIPDARFTIPGYQGQVQQKLVQTINFESDGGILEIFRGRRF